jgi:hypothetical protein
MAEKRTHRRASLVYFLKIHDLDTEQCVGHLVDISLGGFKMLSKSLTIPGSDNHFRISLPEDHPKESFTVKVRNCWSKTDINPDYFASGFCFIALSLESIKLIKMLIHLYELENSTANISY